jgi:hypothetical protein
MAAASAIDPTDPRVGDLNGDGANDGIDVAAATLYRRPNYRIRIIGNLVQNFTLPTTLDYDNELDADGQNFGPVKKSIDTSSYPTQYSTNAVFANKVGATRWNTVEYQADPIPLGVNLYLPVSPDLLYVG